MATVSRGLPERPHLDIPGVKHVSSLTNGAPANGTHSTGSDVHARADVDAAGFGGHTPLFNAVLCGPRKDVEMTRALLARGASPDVRASLRKFLDWTDTPRWHEARDHHGARVGTHVSRSKLGQR